MLLDTQEGLWGAHLSILSLGEICGKLPTWPEKKCGQPGHNGANLTLKMPKMKDVCCCFFMKDFFSGHVFGWNTLISDVENQKMSIAFCKKWMIQRFTKSSTSITDQLTGPHFALLWSLPNKLFRQTTKQPNMGQSRYHALERGSFRKGQLILKCLFDVFNSAKKGTKTIWLEVP